MASASSSAASIGSSAPASPSVFDPSNPPRCILLPGWDACLSQLLAQDSIIGRHVVDLPRKLLPIAPEHRFGNDGNLLGVDRYDNMVALYDSSFISRLTSIHQTLVERRKVYMSAESVAARQAAGQWLDALFEHHAGDISKLQELEQQDLAMQLEEAMWMDDTREEQQRTEALASHAQAGTALFPAPEKLRHGDMIQFNVERHRAALYVYRAPRGTFARLCARAKERVDTLVRQIIEQKQGGVAHVDATETVVKTMRGNVASRTVHLPPLERDAVSSSSSSAAAAAASADWEVLLFPTMDGDGYDIPPALADAPVGFFKPLGERYTPLRRMVYPALPPFNDAVTKAAAEAKGAAGADSSAAAATSPAAAEEGSSMISALAAQVRARVLHPAYCSASPYKAGEEQSVDLAHFPSGYICWWNELAADEATERADSVTEWSAPFSPADWQDMNNEFSAPYTGEESFPFLITKWIKQ